MDDSTQNIPLKNREDNMLRLTTELHVLLTILAAFVMKISVSSPNTMNHEKMSSDDYGILLTWSMVLCVVVTFLYAVYSKLRRAWAVDNIEDDSWIGAFKRLTRGLASSDDRCQLYSVCQEIRKKIVAEWEGDQRADALGRQQAGSHRLSAPVLSAISPLLMTDANENLSVKC